MLKTKLYATFCLALMLAACGGSSGDIDNPNGGGTSADVEEVPEGGIAKPRLGAGAGGTFSAGNLEVSIADVSAGGNVQIAANIVDADRNNAQITSESFVVEFSSVCADKKPAKAEFSEPKVETSSGSVSVTYTAKGCVGEDIINARLYRKSGDGGAVTTILHTAKTSINVESAEIGAISFVETGEPTALSIKTIANPTLPTLTTVTFQVVDKFGNPIEGQEVHFTLGNDFKDVELARNSNITDSTGTVEAIVNSGTTHALAIVNAETVSADGNKKIRTSSQPISVTTGIPRQDNFSLSASVFNPAAFNVDGETVTITARASDVFANPIPQGTIVNFTAESGIIDASCAVSNSGECSVTWTSSGTRPGNKNPAYEQENDRLGMTTILAYTLGEAGFTDKNSNYIFDAGEPFVAYGEPFRDDNWDGLRGDTEFYVDTDNDGNYSQAAAPAKYQGALCSDEMKAEGHCESLMHVRTQLRIVQSFDGNPVIRAYDCSAAPACVELNYSNLEVLDKTNGGEVYVVLQDKHGNMPPSGTSLAIEGSTYNLRADDGEVNNNVGELSGTEYARGFNGLPDFGMLYKVEYKPLVAGTGGEIKFEASNGSKVTRLYLDAAP